MLPKHLGYYILLPADYKFKNRLRPASDIGLPNESASSCKNSHNAAPQSGAAASSGLTGKHEAVLVMQNIKVLLQFFIKRFKKARLSFFKQRMHSIRHRVKPCSKSAIDKITECFRGKTLIPAKTFRVGAQKYLALSRIRISREPDKLKKHLPLLKFRIANFVIAAESKNFAGIYDASLSH